MHDSEDYPAAWYAKARHVYRTTARTCLFQRIWQILGVRQDQAQRTHIDDEGPRLVKVKWKDMAAAFGVKDGATVWRHFNGEVKDCWGSWALACLLLRTDPSDTVVSNDEMDRAATIAVLNLIHNELLERHPRHLTEGDYEVLQALRRRSKEWQLAHSREDHDHLQSMVGDCISDARRTAGTTPSVSDPQGVDDLYNEWEESIDACSELLAELEPYYVSLD